MVSDTIVQQMIEVIQQYELEVGDWEDIMAMQLQIRMGQKTPNRVMWDLDEDRLAGRNTILQLKGLVQRLQQEPKTVNA